MNFRFLEPAEAEFLEAIAYYAEKQADLAVRFEAAVSETVREAVANPERGAPRSKNTRRRLVKGFPFSVIYSAFESEVLIVAIAHNRRRAEYWSQRTEA